MPRGQRLHIWLRYLPRSAWNVLGVGLGFHGYTVPDAPTDSNGASGDWPGNQANAQVVEWVNVSYAVFNKATGAYLAGPISGQHALVEPDGQPVRQPQQRRYRGAVRQDGAPLGAVPAGIFGRPSRAALPSPPALTRLGSYYLYQFPQNTWLPRLSQVAAFSPSLLPVAEHLQRCRHGVSWRPALRL